MRRSILLTLFAAFALAAVACTNTEVKPPATPAPSQTSTPAVTPSAAPSASVSAKGVEVLVGRWPGVEGTYLNITKKGENYSVEIANLDGPKTYDGTAKGDTIEFKRNGKTETIKASNGAETGMKGFEKETNCVVVTKGTEGFCKSSK